MERQSFYVSCPDSPAPWRQSSDIRMNITPIETELTGSIESSVTSVKKPLMTARTIAAAISAPIISAYCVASVVWSRIFLKEKLSWKHYAMIALVVVGIVMLGVFDI